jgi:hypothetical protein
MNPRDVIDYDGLGQSGYTAGRTRDAALARDVITEYPHPNQDDERAGEDNGTIATDDRFTGRSGPTSHHADTHS